MSSKSFFCSYDFFYAIDDVECLKNKGKSPILIELSNRRHQMKKKDKL